MLKKLISKIENLDNLFLSDDCEANEKKLPLFRYVIIFVSIFTGTLGFAVYGSSPTNGISLLATSLMSLVSLLVYEKYGNRYTAFNILMVFGTFAVHFPLLAYPQNYKPSVLFWLIGFPMGTGLLTDHKHTAVWTAITILNASLVFLIYPTLDKDPFFIGCVLSVILYSGVMTFLFRLKHHHLLEEKELARKDYQQLIRVVCHDIANPVTVIEGAGGMAQLSVKKGNLSKAEHYLTRLKRANDGIVDILTSVRMFEKNKTNKGKTQVHAVEVLNALDYLREIFEEKLKKKDLNLIVDCPDENLTLLATKTGFQNQILANLLSNAIKFSPLGSDIIVTCKEENNYIGISVKDSGVGIPVALIEELFDPTKTVSRKGTNGETGTGFGLPIVKSFMTLIDGEIEVQSCENEGTEFILKFKKAA